MSDDYWNIMADNTLSYEEKVELGLIPSDAEYDPSNYDFDLSEFSDDYSEPLDDTWEFFS